jgi:alanine racemase
MRGPRRPSKIATREDGYADGLTRALSAGANLWHGAQPVPLVGRVSMNLITAGRHRSARIARRPGPDQTVDELAARTARSAMKSPRRWG